MSKRTVLLVLIDGMRHDYLNPADAPFLHALAQRNIDATVRETFAFELRPAFFAGLHPEECGVANMFCYDPDDSPFRDIDVSDGDRARITAAVRAEAARRGWSLVKHIGNCAGIPLPLLKYFSFAEKMHTADPGAVPGHETLFDQLRRAGKKWLWIGYPDGPNTTDGVARQFAAALTGDEDFIYLHFSELDWVGHEDGPHSPRQKQVLAEIDAALRGIYARLNRTFAGVRSIVFGDHGQVAITLRLDLAARLRETGLTIERDYLCFLDSTQARFWFFTDDARRKITALLQSLPDGSILTDADRERLRYRMPDRRFGELVFVVHDGVGIFPDYFQHDRPCRGLHGYLPEVPGNWAKLIIAGCGTTAAVADPVGMTDLYPLLLAMLDCPVPAARPVHAGMAQLIAQLTAPPAGERCAASVIIPSCNRRATLERCLAALARQETGEPFEVIVVDDGSTDGTPAFLREFAAATPLRFRFLTQANAGPAAARNAGIRTAAGAVIILIGDDIMVPPDFVARHLAFHAAQPQVAQACLGFIAWAEPHRQSVLAQLLTSSDGGQQFCWHLVEQQAPDDIGPRFFWTSNLSFKRAFVLAHGLFAADRFGHALWEDVELGYRLAQAGLQLHYRRDIRVEHDHAVTFRQFAERQRRVGWHSHDLPDPVLAESCRPRAAERGLIYSAAVLAAMGTIVDEAEQRTPPLPEAELRRLYNCCLRYAMLLGSCERMGTAVSDPERGQEGLLLNLARLQAAVAAGSVAGMSLPATGPAMADPQLFAALARRALAGTAHGALGIYVFGTGAAGNELGCILTAASTTADGAVRDFIGQLAGVRLVPRGFFDNNAARHGTMLCGLPVTAPNPAAVGPDDMVLIASHTHAAAMRAQLRAAGVPDDRIIAAAAGILARRNRG